MSGENGNQFKGTINLDIRDSKPDWDAFLYRKAPKDAPNVLVILYDDTGCAAWSPYGGRISMPTMDRLAANGLTYTQWHTTAVCSPTRSCFLTGRNHHANGFGSISEMAVGFPGYCGHIPPENGTIAQVLRDAGWTTLWIGKNHNVPVDAFSIGATKKKWPLGLGYDRFYGFIGGETNQWYPTLIEDNHFIDQPYQPEDGYHLSKDLADKAITYIRDSRQSEPDKPWYMWFCPGANHAPHHAPQEYIDKYKGKFDDGYEAYREWVLARMIERGIVPKDTELTPINPLPDEILPDADSVRPWDSLSDNEKKLFARMAEVYAGFSIPPEQRLACDAPTLGRHIVGVEFNKESISKNLETLGQMKLYVDDKVVAKGPFRTQSGHYALCGEGLSIGTDSGDSVSSEYKPKFEFTGGRVVKVIFDVAKDVYVNVEKAMAASMARD